MPNTDDAIPLNVPGDDGAPESGPGVVDDSAATIASLRLQVAQLEALNSELQNQLDLAKTVPSAPAASKTPNLIGDRAEHMTSAEAKAAGITKRVLCSDGWFVPGL